MTTKQPKFENLVKYLSLSALTILVLSLVGLVIVASENKHVTPKQKDRTQEATTVKSANYNLVSFTKEGQVIKIPDGTVITLNINGENFSGKASCNNYFGSFQKDDSGVLVISPIGSTKMGCEQDLMDFESNYLQTLQNVNNIKSVEDKIILYSGTIDNTFFEFELAN